MSFLHGVSILLEFALFVAGLRMVFEKKRYVGVAVAVTFGIYVFYDLALAYHWGVTRPFLDAVFFVATCAAAVVVWHLWRKKS